MAAAGAAIVGGSVLSGVMGAQSSQAARDAAANARNSALQQYLNIHVPNVADQQVILQRYASTGKLEPQMEQAVNQKATELLNMQVDPTSRAAEVSALEQMSNVAQSGGLDAQAKQQEAEAIQKANANEAGQRGAIVQNANARGVGGAGAELAAELQASQGDANSAAAGGMSAAAAAQDRALRAMSSSGAMARDLNSADYTQAANKAAAQDAINRFNTQNSQAVSNANVQTTNQAAATNLANSQNLANSNVDLTNKQEVANKGLVQQQFNNELGLAAGRSNAYNGVAAGNQADANATANQWANIGSAIGQGGAAIARGSRNTDGTTADPNATSSSGPAPVNYASGDTDPNDPNNPDYQNA